MQIHKANLNRPKQMDSNITKAGKAHIPLLEMKRSGRLTENQQRGWNCGTVG